MARLLVPQIRLPAALEGFGYTGGMQHSATFLTIVLWNPPSPLMLLLSRHQFKNCGLQIGLAADPVL